MFAAVVAAAVATGCGPADHASSLRTTAGGDTPAATSTPSAPAATPSAPPPARRSPAPAPTPIAKPTPKPASPKPKPVATPTPKPTHSACGAPANPWGYNFCGRGALIYSPAAGVCSYFNCIDNFDNGSGYMVECNDGTYSMSGGHRGACSYHGGEGQPVYSGP